MLYPHCSKILPSNCYGLVNIAHFEFTWLLSVFYDLSMPKSFILVLDNYHLIDSKLVDQIISYLVENLPSQMHPKREDMSLYLQQMPRVRLEQITNH